LDYTISNTTLTISSSRPAPTSEDILKLYSNISADIIPSVQVLTFVAANTIPVSTGAKNTTRIMSPYNGTIVSWKLIVDTSASVTLDVWKSTGIPTNANSITASAKPSITATEYGTSSTLTGWTTSVAVNDIFIMEVEANDNATYINLSIILLATN